MSTIVVIVVVVVVVGGGDVVVVVVVVVVVTHRRLCPGDKLLDVESGHMAVYHGVPNVHYINIASSSSCCCSCCSSCSSNRAPFVVQETNCWTLSQVTLQFFVVYQMSTTRSYSTRSL